MAGRRVGFFSSLTLVFVALLMMSECDFGLFAGETGEVAKVEKAGESKDGEPSVSIPVNAKRLADTIDLATDYLVLACGGDGRFNYRRHLNAKSDVELMASKKYNLLRHAGAIYALGMAYSRKPDKYILSTMVRAADYMRGFIGPVKDYPEASALWTFPRKLGASKKRRNEEPHAKLGGTGLGLIALLSLEKAKKGSVKRDEVVALGNFILKMQKPDGSFVSKYYRESGASNNFVSLYYPGEAMLGLLMLDDYEQDDKWVICAAKALAYLAEIRKNDRKPPVDHWALIATAKLLPKLKRLKDSPVDRDTAIRHAIQIMNVVFNEQTESPEHPWIHGSFGGEARTCPAATRLEGLLAAYEYTPEKRREVFGKIRRTTELGIGYLMRAQIRGGRLKGGIPRGTVLFPKSAPMAKDNDRVGEVRIDYVQHSLSAFIGYERLFVNAGKKVEVGNDRGE